MSALAWLGRQGTKAIMLWVVLGIALPSVGSVMKAYVTHAIFLLLCLAFMGMDVSIFKGYLRRPGLVLLGVFWSALIMPLLVGFGAIALGLSTQWPDFFMALTLQAVASPLMSGPALAALMGLDATLVLVTLIMSTALIPFTAPLLAHFFLGSTLSFSSVAMGLKLLALLLGAAIVAFALRRAIGLATIVQHKTSLSGASILVLFVFLSAMLQSVSEHLWAEPMATLKLTLWGLLIFLVLLISSTLLFLPAGRKRALSMGFAVSQRNMGLMLAATGGQVPELVWLYFGLAQLPIYLSPACLPMLTRRWFKSARSDGVHFTSPSS
jgi:predicted Na+-dependent transporter